jgi:hypothetical protein
VAYAVFVIHVFAPQLDAVCRVVHRFQADDADPRSFEQVVVDATHPHLGVLVVNFGVVGASCILSCLDTTLHELLFLYDVAVTNNLLINRHRLDTRHEHLATR